MTRKSRGTYVLAFGVIVLAGGTALAFLTALGLVLVAIGVAVVAIGALLLLRERTAAKVEALSHGAEAPDRPPLDER